MISTRKFLLLFMLSVLFIIAVGETLKATGCSRKIKKLESE